MRNTLIMKECKYCHTTENLKQRKCKDTFIIMNICNNCFSSVISKKTKEAVDNYTPEKLLQIKENHHKSFYEDKTEDELQIIYKNRGKAISASPKNENRIKGIKKFLDNVDDNYFEERTKKSRKTLSKLSDEEKEKRKNEKSDVGTKRWKQDGFREKVIPIFIEAQNNLSDESRKSKSIKCSNASKKYNESLEDSKRKEITKKATITRSNRSDEEKKETGRKIGAALIKRLKDKEKKGETFTSKAENRCYEYIKNNLDSDVKRQIPFEKYNWSVDFYLPKFDLYVQFDGDYWHGRNLTKENRNDSKLHTAILRTKGKDKLQLLVIPNLVRIWETDFEKDNIFLDNEINNFFMLNFNNDLY